MYTRIARLPLLLAISAVVSLCVFSQEKLLQNVAYVSEQGGGLSIVDLATFQILKTTQATDMAPRGLALTEDGKYLVTANMGTSDISVFDAQDLRLIRRIHVGDNPEFVRVHPNGKWIFVSTELPSAAHPSETAEKAKDDPVASQIVQVNVADWSLGRTFAAGSETEGIEFSPDGKSLIVANEGENSLSIFSIGNGQHERDVNLASYGDRPRGLKVSPSKNAYAVTMELSGTLVLLNQNFQFLRSAQTGAMPDGVAFDRKGEVVVVGASGAQKLQFFSTDSLELMGQAAVGQRCWHFTFTPDDAQVLAACGRSNNIFVVDAKTYQPVRTLDGFHMPWGIVTYPHSYGSLDLP
jgi:DNA-binding beta-propeller fold protein YncE